MKLQVHYKIKATNYVFVIMVHTEPIRTYIFLLLLFPANGFLPGGICTKIYKKNK